MNHLSPTLSIWLFTASALTTLAFGESPFANVRNLTAEWVKTKRQTAQELHEWEGEKETLQNLIQLFTEEEADIAKRIEDAKGEATKSDEEREKLRAERDRLKAVEEMVKATLAKQEKKLLGLNDWLPEPLKDRTTSGGGISNLIEKVPADPEKTDMAMSRRLQTILVTLSLLDKFNNNVLVEHGAREIDGKTVNVTTLYFGLAGGFYVDGTGTRAGVLIPAKGGWKEESRNDIAPDLSKAVAIYEKTTAEEAHFFQLPVQFISTNN